MIHGGTTMFIDRPWSGTSNYMNSGCTLVKDDLYDIRPQAGIDAGWDADGVGMPVFNYNSNPFGLLAGNGDRYWQFYGLAFKNSTDALGCIGISNANVVGHIYSGCSILQASNAPGISLTGDGNVITKTVIQGNAANNSSMHGISIAGVNHTIRQVSIQGMYSGIYGNNGSVSVAGLNVGVERPMSSASGADIRPYLPFSVSGSNVWCTGSGGGGYVTYNSAGRGTRISIENWYKVIGRHRIFTPQGVLERTEVSADLQVPAQRTHGNTGAGYLIEGTYNLGTTTAHLPKALYDYSAVVFTHEYDADTTSKTYRYYIADNYDGSTAGARGYTHTSGTTKFWLEAEYIKASGSSVTNYAPVTASGATTFSGTTNWQNQPNYVEITIQPAVASKVRITGRVSAYTDRTPARRFWVDPRPYVY
jgi:hypothetical protein